MTTKKSNEEASIERSFRITKSRASASTAAPSGEDAPTEPPEQRTSEPK